MSDNINEKLNAAVDAANTEPVKADETAKEPVEVSLGYVLSRIEKLLDDNAHIMDALRVLNTTEHGTPGQEPYAPADVAGKARMDAIADVVKCRETTIQHALSFYQKMYEEVKPSPMDIALAQAERILSSPMSAQFDEAEVWDIIMEAFKKSLQGQQKEESRLEFKTRAIISQIQCQEMSPQEMKELLAILDE